MVVGKQQRVNIKFTLFVCLFIIVEIEIEIEFFLVGANSQNATSILKTDWNDQLNL